jgi:XTP/dITP diphosphohydrolase
VHLYLATTNPGKLRDFAHALVPGVELIPLAGITDFPTPDETADTFQSNAEIKARAYSLAAPGMLVLADDSGIEVDALLGAPGVRSARYAEDCRFCTNSPVSTDTRNNLCLLDALARTASTRRTARYRCVLALAHDGEILATADGKVEGEILHTPRGQGGFGYDPIFLLPEPNLTMAEIDPDTRQRYSHRARALQTLLAKLQHDPKIAQYRR